MKQPLWERLAVIQFAVRKARDSYRDGKLNEARLNNRLNAIEAALGDVIAEMQKEAKR